MQIPLRAGLAFGAALYGALAVFAAANAFADGLRVQLRGSEARDASVEEVVDLYTNSHALVVGNDEYTDGWPRLGEAVNDAKRVAEALIRRGFDVTLKTDLGSDDLKSAFEDFFIEKGRDPDARLFVWYAGHGATVSGEGYLIPSDGALPKDEVGFLRSALSLRRFGEFVRLARSKHVFAVFDSCFAGTIFSVARAAPPPQVTRITTMPVRQFLTSGDAGQLVSDDGTFATLFIEALDGERSADGNADGYLTASELGVFLDAKISNYTRNKQTPRYGKLRSPAFDKGDFVFVVGGNHGPPRTAALTPKEKTGSAEVMFWESVRGSDDPESFRAYLEQYPDGAFVALARLNVRKLRGLKLQTVSEPEIEELDAIYVVLKTANLRAGPSTETEKLGTVAADNGISVTGVARDRKWYRVAHAGGAAFIFGNLISPIDAAELAAWNDIADGRDSDSTATFHLREFLQAYPDGHFAERAKRMLASLRPAEIEIESVFGQWTVRSETALRKRPDPASKPLARLGGGSGITITGKVKGSDWYRAELLGGLTGYLPGARLDKRNPEPRAPDKPLPGDIEIDPGVLRVVRSQPFFANPPAIRLAGYSFKGRSDTDDGTTDGSVTIDWLKPGISIVQSDIQVASSQHQDVSHVRSISVANGFLDIAFVRSGKSKLPGMATRRYTSTAQTYSFDSFTGDSLYPVKVGKRFGYTKRSRIGFVSSPSKIALLEKVACAVDEELEAAVFHRLLSGRALVATCRTETYPQGQTQPNTAVTKKVFFEELGYWLAFDPKSPPRRLTFPTYYTTLERLDFDRPRTVGTR